MNVGIYTRVSSLAQDVDLSISAQINALRKYALANDMVIAEEYIEEAESGRSADRPAFLRMISDAQQEPRPFEAILVWKLNRFARNREDSIVFKAILKRFGIQVISINEPVEDGPSGQLLAGIIESIDEFYSLNLAQDVVRGMREAASRGFWVNSRAPYGYRRERVVDGSKDRVTLKIEDGKSEVVVEIFRMVLAGSGVKDIATQLNTRGVPSPDGKRWGRGRVHKILINPAYAGTLVFGESGRYHLESGLEPVIVENAFPAIIDRQTFDRVQATLKARAPKIQQARRAGSRFLLSGILVCGECGAAMIGHAAKSGAYAYYTCGTAYRLGKEECSGTPVEKDLIERSVMARVLNVILTEPNLERLVELTNKVLRSRSESSKAESRVIERELLDVRKRTGRLYDVIEKGELVMTDLAPRIRELREREKVLARDLQSLRSTASENHVKLVRSEEVLRYLLDLKSLLSAGTLSQRKTFLKSFVKRIRKNGNTIETEYTLPLPLEKSSLGAEGVPPTVSFGGAGGIRTLYLVIANDALSQLSYSP